MEKCKMSDEMRRKKIIKRSPGYPIFSLEEALVRARKLWKEDRNNKMHIDTVYEHLGYESQGGYGARVIAALKKFGLISQSKDDIVLTADAVDIMLHEPKDEEYIRAIKITALMPDIYSKLYNEYNGVLPSDKTIAVKLIKDYGFNPKKVSGLIKGFRDTIKFARLTGEDLEKETEDEDREDDTDKTFKKIKKEAKDYIMTDTGDSFNIPLVAQNTVTLAFTKLPIEKRDLDRIKQWLDLMEEPLVKTEVKEAYDKDISEL